MTFATVWPIRRLITSASVLGLRLARMSSVSPMPSTLFQKKNFSDTPCRCFETRWKRR